MAVKINFSQRYFWLNSWVLSNILQLGVQDFCEKFVTYKIDPCGRLYDQIVLAARCVTANIAEGTSRRNTSIETEMRLVDVARASNDEVFGDMFNYILRRTGYVWEIGQPDREEIWRIELDRPNYTNNLHHDAAVHILKQKDKFSKWLDNEDPCVRANAILVLCLKLNKMLQSMMESELNQFKANGGFTENMTQERLETRKSETANAPRCPKCGSIMIKRVAKKGPNSGNEFWSCSAYPQCLGTLPLNTGK